MGFLLISIVCSVLVSVLLKLARPNNINLSLAITVNYAVCAMLTLFVLKPAFGQEMIIEGMNVFIALGILLPSVFLIMGKSVVYAGIVKSDTAQRLALIIPIIAAFVLFGETLTAAKITALILVFVAMGCLLYKRPSPNTSQKDESISNHRYATYSLMGVFFGYGVIDVLLKQLSKMGNTIGSNLFASFIFAFIFMTIFSMYKKYQWQKTSIIGGLMLGLLNFTNIYTYINAHQAMSNTPTIVFAVMNMGVIVLGALTGLIVFKEKLSTINLLGLMIALIAIARLYFY